MQRVEIPTNYHEINDFLKYANTAINAESPPAQSAIADWDRPPSVIHESVPCKQHERWPSFYVKASLAGISSDMLEALGRIGGQTMTSTLTKIVADRLSIPCERNAELHLSRFTAPGEYSIVWSKNEDGSHTCKVTLAYYKAMMMTLENGHCIAQVRYRADKNTFYEVGTDACWEKYSKGIGFFPNLVPGEKSKFKASNKIFEPIVLADMSFALRPGRAAGENPVLECTGGGLFYHPKVNYRSAGMLPEPKAKGFFPDLRRLKQALEAFTADGSDLKVENPTAVPDAVERPVSRKRSL